MQSTLSDAEKVNFKFVPTQLRTISPASLSCCIKLGLSLQWSIWLGPHHPQSSNHVEGIQLFEVSHTSPHTLLHIHTFLFIPHRI